MLGTEYVQRDLKPRLDLCLTTYLVALLPPWHGNLGKRLAKTPKIYFLDPGLLTTLLGIRSADELETHSMRGAIFESWVVSEAVKAAWNRGRIPELHFFRTHAGHEVDLLVGENPVEIKSGTTLVADWFRGLTDWEKLTGSATGRGLVLYGGDTDHSLKRGTLKGWRNVPSRLADLS